MISLLLVDANQYFNVGNKTIIYLFYYFIFLWILFAPWWSFNMSTVFEFVK